mgnify:CR=1 FL=1
MLMGMVCSGVLPSTRESSGERSERLYAIDGVNGARHTHLEVRKLSEITLSHAGEIDFEEFLLVIKNMQNPGQ